MRGRNAMGIYQDLVDRRGFRSSYQSVQRFVRKLRGATAPEARTWSANAQQSYASQTLHRSTDEHSRLKPSNFSDGLEFKKPM